MEILLTGGSGFVGRHCVPLISGEHEVIQIGRTEAVSDRYLTADLTDRATMAKLSAVKPEVLIHMASAIPGRSKEFFKANVTGTFNLLDSIDASRLKKIILLSSVSVYDMAGPGPFVFEETSQQYTGDEYGKTKLAQEFLVRSFCGRSIPFLIFRLSSVYGPGYNTDTLLPIFLKRTLKGEDLLVQVRNYRQNFIYVKDIAEAVRQGAEGDQQGIYNLFSPDTLTIEELGETMIETLGSKARLVREYKGEQPDREFRNTAFCKAFPGVKFTGIREGIRAMATETHD